MKKLIWVKEIFGSKLEILSGAEKIGAIQWQNMFSGKATAVFNGRTFFLKREFFLSKLEIYDGKDQSLLACVMVNLFNPKSDVVINGKRFELEIKNFWQSRWSWKFNGVEVVSFVSNEFVTKEKGEIDLYSSCNDEVEIMILLGLFVRNQFILVILFFVVILLLIIF
jgi:hypothetical protein